MNGTASALLAIVGAFFIAVALHGCEAEARPGDYSKRACARGSTKACVRLCKRGFPGYCTSSTERRSKSFRTNVRAKRSWPGSAEEARPPPMPTPRPFDRLALIDDTFALTEVEPLIPFAVDRPKRTRALTISHTPPKLAPEPVSLAWLPAIVAFALGIALATHVLSRRRHRHRPRYAEPYLPTM